MNDLERREAVGIVLIAVVASALVTIFIQGESDVPFEVLEERVPEMIPPGSKTTHGLSLGIILRRDVESLTWDFDCLINVTDRDGEPTRTVDRAIGTCVRLCEQIGIPYLRQEIEIEGGRGVLYDFSPAFPELAPGSAVLSATTVYALVEVGGRNVSYRGVSDFFLNREKSLSSISLSRNEKPETYITAEAGQASAMDRPSIMDAPALGTIRYMDNGIDDRFSMGMVINAVGIPVNSGMMEVVRIYADRELRMARGYLISES